MGRQVSRGLNIVTNDDKVKQSKKELFLKISTQKDDLANLPIPRNHCDMGEFETISAEEYAQWVPVATAISLRKSLDWDKRIDQFIQRLAHGHLRASAQHADQDGHSIDYHLISKDLWRHAQRTSAVWFTGDITILFPSPGTGMQSGLMQQYGYNDSAAKEAVLFGVRLDPAGLEKFIPQFGLLHTISIRTEIGSIGIPNSVLELIREIYPEQPSVEPKSESGPPVSDAHLAEWYELYRKVYSGSEDTTARAEASARGCFPGKSVSRQRIRDLFEERKRGRKAHPENQ